MASLGTLLIIMKLLIIIIIEDCIIVEIYREIYKEKIGPASARSAGPAATALYKYIAM